MGNQTVVKQLARSFHAKERCEISGNENWYNKHSALIDYIVENYLPSGSDVDSG